MMRTVEGELSDGHKTASECADIVDRIYTAIVTVVEHRIPRSSITPGLVLAGPGDRHGTLDLDSLQALELALYLEETFSISVVEELESGLVTNVGQLCQLVTSRVADRKP